MPPGRGLQSRRTGGNSEPPLLSSLSCRRDKRADETQTNSEKFHLPAPPWRPRGNEDRLRRLLVSGVGRALLPPPRLAGGVPGDVREGVRSLGDRFELLPDPDARDDSGVEGARPKWLHVHREVPEDCHAPAGVS